MISIPPINNYIVIEKSPLVHSSYVEQYTKDEDFKEVYESVMYGSQNEELDYHIHDKLLYNLGKTCIPQNEIMHAVREAHTSLISRHFGVGKTVAPLQKFCYWSRMNDIVSKCVKGCVMCATTKPNNRKLWLYTPLPVPSRSWKSVNGLCRRVANVKKKT